MKGRKPIPTKLHILHGNPSKFNLDERIKREPKPKPCLPKAPKHLDEVAKKEFRKMARKLYRIGILTEIDASALALYASAYSRWVEAEEQIKRTGTIGVDKNGRYIQNPFLKVSRQAAETMIKLLTEFGMTPSSRSRVHVEKKDSDLTDEELKKLLEN